MSTGFKRSPFSEEHKKKLSESHKGKKRPPRTEEWNKKISNALKGKKRSIEVIRRMSTTQRGIPRPDRRGEKSNLWKGGITPINLCIRGSLQYKLWEDSVFNQNNNACVRCNEERISKLVAHHILNFAQYPELRFAIDNGITLCNECHKNFHRKYGIKYNTKEQLYEYLG